MQALNQHVSQKNSNGFIRVFVCRDTGLVLYVIRPGRGATAPCQSLFGIEIEEASILEGAPTGKKRITVDKYSACKRLERYGFAEQTHCWAHQRREFIDPDPDSDFWHCCIAPGLNACLLQAGGSLRTYKETWFTEYLRMIFSDATGGGV